MTQATVLIIEDDPVSAATVDRAAQELGCVTTLAETFQAGLDAAEGARFDLVIVDRMLPGGDGIDAIAKLRADGQTALVLVVSALGRASNRIEGLERGADDYLAKPFDAAELRARIRALLRRVRMQVSDNDLLVFGDLEIRLKARTVHVGSEHIKLTPKEFDLLVFFARNAGEPVTRMQLLEGVWNLHFDPGTNVVDVHIGRLRRKLEAGGKTSFIQTERGEGYVFGPIPLEAAG